MIKGVTLKDTDWDNFKLKDVIFKFEPIYKYILIKDDFFKREVLFC